MVLAQFCKIKPYLEFFQKKVEEGDLVILDNGAYEGVVTPGWELNQWARELKPEVVVLPDEPGNAAETWKKSLDYMHSYGVPKCAMQVLHAADGDYWAFENQYLNCKHASWIGLSRLTKFYDRAFVWPEQRVGFAKSLKVEGLWRKDLHHHALGMLDAHLPELEALARLGFDSCDSSAPIWRGLHGYSIWDPAWPNYSFDPEAGEFAPNGLQRAEMNLEITLEQLNA